MHQGASSGALGQSVKSDKVSQERQQDISKTIGRLVFDLFDLDYHEYKASLILQRTANKTTRSRLEQLLSTRSEAEAIQDFLKEQQTNSVPELDFEDIIMFSDIDEIPDFTTLDLIDDYLLFNSIILRQKRFFFSK